MSTLKVPVDEYELYYAIMNLLDALEPMVPYKIDPLEFCREAHKVKDELIQSALAHLPQDVVEQAKTRKAQR